MGLAYFGFVLTGDDFVQHQGTDDFRMTVVCVRDPADGVDAARELVAVGVQLIELCGSFSPVWAGKIVEAVDDAVPVGVVGYGPEAIDGMYELFAE